MSTSNYVVVDIGTKTGGALDVFRKHHGMYFVKQNITAADCLGIDRNATYREKLVARGYNFAVADLATPSGIAALPMADYFTAFHILEHMPSVAVAQDLLRGMMMHARIGVWLRMPSFEFEPELHDRHLQYYWQNWKCHTAAFRLAHVYEVRDSFKTAGTFSFPYLRVKGTRKIVSTSSRDVVPVGETADTHGYEKDMASKPDATFDKPIAGEYEVIIRRSTV